MTAPDPHHIDAIAQTIDPAAWEEGGWLRKATKPVAARLLDSTDPAVHAAMLDALTRHGVLTEQDAPLSFGTDGAGWYPRWDGNHTDEGSRLVTAWEVTP